MVDLSETKEDYIRAIYKLGNFGEENGVRVSRLAEMLGLAKSTVSERLAELIDAKLAKKDGTLYALTKEGRSVAQHLTYKHRLIEVFLYQTLGIRDDREMHEQACKLEHAFTDETIEKLAAFLNHPITDPHGQPLKR